MIYLDTVAKEKYLEVLFMKFKGIKYCLLLVEDEQNIYK